MAPPNGMWAIIHPARTLPNFVSTENETAEPELWKPPPGNVLKRRVVGAEPSLCTWKALDPTDSRPRDGDSKRRKTGKSVVARVGGLERENHKQECLWPNRSI